MKLKSTINQKKTLLTLSILSILSAVVCCILGEIFLPLCIALLAVIRVFDTSKNRSYVKVVMLSFIALNIASFTLGITPSLFGFSAVILAAMLSKGFIKRGNKSDNAFMMSVVGAIFTTASFILLAMVDTGKYTMNAVKAYYAEIAEVLKELVNKSINQVDSSILEGSGIAFTPEMIDYTFSYIRSLLISFLFIASFIMVGVSMKIFGMITKRLSEDKASVEKWRINLTPVYAYFYLLLSIAAIFMSSTTDTFAIAVLNLNNIFTVVFAYVGYKFLVTVLSGRMNAKFASIIVLVAIVLFSSVAIQVVSIIGLLQTLRSRRSLPPPPKQS